MKNVLQITLETPIFNNLVDLRVKTKCLTAHTWCLNNLHHKLNFLCKTTTTLE